LPSPLRTGHETTIPPHRFVARHLAMKEQLIAQLDEPDGIADGY
jgi:hypothetical protein